MKVINLLPKDRQQELRYEDIFHSVSRAGLLVAVILVVVLTGQFGLHAYLTHHTSTLAAQTEDLKRRTDKGENAQLKAEIKLDNAYMADYKNLGDTTPHWSKVLLAFAALIPQDVKINTLTADLATKRVVINGQSPTRDGVIELYNNISKDSKNFYDIDYPLENVAQPTDVSFHYSFTIRDDLLK